MDDHGFRLPTEEEKQKYLQQDFEHGFTLPSEEEKSKYVSPEESSTVSDLATGAAQGLTFGFSDELLAALKAAKETAVSKEKGLKDLPALYRQYQQLEQEKVRRAKEASPYAYFAGELGGGVLPALFTGGGTAAARGAAAAAETATFLPSVVRGAKLGAGYGALAGAGTSEAGIEDTGEFAKEVGKGALGGATFGAVAGAAGDLTKKAIEAAGENRTLRQMGIAFTKGKEGIPLHGGSEAEGKLSAIPKETGSSITTKLLNAKNILGKRLDDVLEKNKNIPISKEPNESFVSNVYDFLESKKTLFGPKDDTEKVRALLDRYNTGGITPKEARDLKNILSQTAYDYQKLDPGIFKGLKKFSDSLKKQLKNNVPGFEDANNNYTMFLKSAPETVLSGGIPAENLETFLSEQSDAGEKLVEAISEIVKRVEKPGTSADSQRNVLYQMMKNLRTLEAEKPGLLKEIEFDPEQILNQIRKTSDFYNTSAAIRGHEPHSGPVTSTIAAVTPRGTAFRGAQFAGKAVGALEKAGTKIEKTLPGRLSKEAFTWGNEKLSEVANKLMSSSDKKLQMLGEGLSGSLEKGGIAHRAVLFTILQSPDARRTIADMYPGVGEE